MDLTRRQLLAGVGGELALVGGARATDNVVLGYGTVTGTNLKAQDLDSLVGETLSPDDGPVATVDGHRVERRDGRVVVRERGDEDPVAAFDPSTADPADAAAVDADIGLSGDPLSELVADLGALDAGNVRFRYGNYPTFFELLEAAETRPHAVSALRGRLSADGDTVAEFAGADPADPEAVAEGLVGGFREHTGYDVERYLAGSIEDNVLMGRYDLRERFESPTDFESIVAGENDGLFCSELTRRSIEALQAVPAREQAPPVFAGYVRNSRHKHAYTIVASAVRNPPDVAGMDARGETDGGSGDDPLVIPVTFLDYTHSTLYDDLRARWLLGEGLAAYDSRHRATEIRWYR